MSDLFSFWIRNKSFGGLWCLHFHFVPFLSLLYSVLYALIIRTKSRRAYTSLHTKLFIKHFQGLMVGPFSAIFIMISQYVTVSILIGHDFNEFVVDVRLRYCLTSKYLGVKTLNFELKSKNPYNSKP